MTRKEARRQLMEFVGTFECPFLPVEAVEMAIEALSERTGDLISRADAKQQISEWATIITKPTLLDKDATMVVLDTLPSAESKTGEWILECDSEGEGDNLYRCSECGCEYGCQEYDKPNFCPDCGAYMKSNGA